MTTRKRLPYDALGPRANGLEVLVALEDGEGRVSHLHAVELVVHFAFTHVVMLGDI